MQPNKLLALSLLCGGVMTVHAGPLPQAVADINQFQEFRLAQGEIYELYVKSGDGTTTVTFPSAISKIAGVNVAADASSDFLIAAKPGSYYFNLVALKKGATGTLTVIHNPPICGTAFMRRIIDSSTSAGSKLSFRKSSGITGRIRLYSKH